jgi:hypothetical protein
MAPASLADLAKDLNWFTAKGKPYKSKVHRTLARLKRDELVRLERGRFVPTDKGKKALRTRRQILPETALNAAQSDIVPQADGVKEQRSV